MEWKAHFLEGQILAIDLVNEPEYYDLKQSNTTLSDDEIQETDVAQQ